MSIRLRAPSTAVASGAAVLALATGGLLAAGSSASGAAGDGTLLWAQNRYAAACAALAPGQPTLPAAQRLRLLNDVADARVEIRGLGGTMPSALCPVASPSPTPSTTATPSASPTVTVEPTTAPPSTTSPPSPSPSPTATGPSTGFPGPTNTGVPAGTTLAAYTGSCTVSVANTVISAKTVNCPGGLNVAANGVRIVNSRVTGAVKDAGGSVAVSWSEVDAGNVSDAAITCVNGSSVDHANVHGGHASVQSNGGPCTLTASWLHDQGYKLIGSHLNGFLSNVGQDLTVRGNTIACTDPLPRSQGGGGGCTGPFAIFGDFGPVSRVVVDGNLFVGQPVSGFAQAYCFYGGDNAGTNKTFHADHVVVTNNVFGRGQTGDRNEQRCGFYGASTAFDTSAPGNAWSGNVYDSGEPVLPNATD